MRKQNPNDVIDDFENAVGDALATWKGICVQVKENPLKKNASADAFINLAVSWETFPSDWHLAAINRDASVFKANLVTRVEAALGGPLQGLKGLVRVNLPMHPRLETVRQLADPDGANLSLSSKDRWVTRARQDLAPPYQDRVTAVSDDDHALLAAVVGIRNCLAHRSSKSRDVMNAALAAMGAGDSRLMRTGSKLVQPSGIGAYLYADAGGSRRVELYFERVTAIGRALRV